MVLNNTLDQLGFSARNVKFEKYIGEYRISITSTGVFLNDPDYGIHFGRLLDEEIELLVKLVESIESRDDPEITHDERATVSAYLREVG